MCHLHLCRAVRSDCCYHTLITMATVKLVSSQSHHLSHYYPHHPLLVHPTSPPQQIMTLDYSLPQRSASTEYDPGSDSTREMSSPASPEEPYGRDPHGLTETPTKKNKRKLSEPKKRADLNSKKPLPSSHTAKESIQESSQDSQPGSRKGKKIANGHCKVSSISSSTKARTSNNDVKRDTSSSSSSVSNIDSDSSKENPLASLANVVPPHFLSPMFSGVQPPAFGYVPGIYLAGRTFSRPGIHTSFPSIPQSLQHSYITAAAAAVSHSSSPPASSLPSASASSLYSLTVARLAGSKTERTVSELHQPHQPPLPAPVSSSIPSSISSSIPPPPSPFSVLHLQPSSLHRPSSSRTVTGNDDDEALSSRAQSPEDLSVGGRLSRKHRKNYKNMTRERRVEANARERTRVHTISAAFDALRRAVPSYSHNQKLSKLAILRIASSYILALARLTDQDYSSATDHIRKPLTFAECVDMCTSTIQTEGRARRRH